MRHSIIPSIVWCFTYLEPVQSFPTWAPNSSACGIRLSTTSPLQPKVVASLPSASSTTPSSSALPYSRYDNLISGIAEISMGTSIGVLMSELSIWRTGCGPSDMSDWLERFCYQGVIVFAGAALLSRILLGRSGSSPPYDPASALEEQLMERNILLYPLEELTKLQVRAAELLALASVVGAVVVLANQMQTGVSMDGLSGIDVQMCKSMRDFRDFYSSEQP